MANILRYCLSVLCGLLLCVFCFSPSSLSVSVFWVSFTLLSYLKFKNRLLNLLLVMEIMAMLTLVLSMFWAFSLSSSSHVIFVFMGLSVGEAVLSLAILVRSSRTFTQEHVGSLILW